MKMVVGGGENEKRQGLMYVITQTSGCIIKIHWIIITDNEQTSTIFFFFFLYFNYSSAVN